VQTITSTSDNCPTSGVFREAYDSQVSTALNHGIGALGLKTALDGIATVGGIEVEGDV